jgi:hypothetical protein
VVTVAAMVVAVTAVAVATTKQPGIHPAVKKEAFGPLFRWWYGVRWRP